MSRRHISFDLDQKISAILLITLDVNWRHG